MSEAKVLLRAVTEADLPDHIRWYNDPEVMEFFGMEFGNITLENRRAWFERMGQGLWLGRNKRSAAH